ncbi:MAG TPA: tRNA epoxyqueuosine(34) reductase QueG, partial [Thermoanaerobaculia bacterium]
MDPHATAERLKAWAVEAGFDRAGVASLEPAATGEAFLRWIERGDQAGMDYLARRMEARLEPATVIAGHPGARSALCVALQYHPIAEEPEGDLWPRVARYARGLDYHDVMGERLTALEARILEAFPGTASRRYIDTGPVLERELAARAGLGAPGKNTNLLHPEAGSWFLLGELFLSLDLAPDVPLADLCGTCTRCLEACPTGALPEPYRLDSNRCISYWTIEHRGPLPAAAREMVGEWVFGCDLCQEVCPWNGAPAAG